MGLEQYYGGYSTCLAYGHLGLKLGFLYLPPNPTRSDP